MLHVWHMWVVVGIFLFIAEVFTTGFLVACFGVGCLASGFTAYFGAGLTAQLLTFSISTAAALVAVRPFFKRLSARGPELKTNVDALLGQSGRVSEKINPAANTGRVLIGGDDWRALSVNDKEIDEGHRVIVVKVAGTKVFVKEEEQ